VSDDSNPATQQRDPQSSAVLSAAVEVHKQMGFGFLEEVYLNALCLELIRREIPFRREFAIPVFYKDVKLSCGSRADLLCFGSLLVELKAQSGLSEIDDAQVINYLRATRFERALLLNFGTPKLQIKRLILTSEYRSQPEKAQGSTEPLL
jgi:GxxExxY protein